MALLVLTLLKIWCGRDTKYARLPCTTLWEVGAGSILARLTLLVSLRWLQAIFVMLVQFELP